MMKLQYISVLLTLLAGYGILQPLDWKVGSSSMASMNSRSPTIEILIILGNPKEWVCRVKLSCTSAYCLYFGGHCASETCALMRYSGTQACLHTQGEQFEDLPF
ncbi:hypothetical protein TNCV_2319741 [Trichonephila clavipes]|nr:hypothetical protein TNCV_2319741 [Trichonephila clavipes]